MEEDEVEPEGPNLSSFAHLFVEMVPQLSQLLTALGEVPYSHPTLATAPEFRSGLPAKDLIPAKEPNNARRVQVKCLPAWKLEPDLYAFGPYFKKAGVVYSPQDLSILARAIPDVKFLSLFFTYPFAHLLPQISNPTYGPCLACLALGKGNLCRQGLKFGEKCLPCKGRDRVCSHNWSLDERAELFDATYAVAKSGPQGPYLVTLFFPLPCNIHPILGIQDALDCLGTSRAAYDGLELVLHQTLKSMAAAHERLGRDFLRLHDAVVDPSLFFQALLEKNPDTEITYDLLSYYATLFDWDSSLNFRSVISGFSSVSEWLASNNVAISIAEPSLRKPSFDDHPSSSVAGRESTPAVDDMGQDVEDGEGEPEGDIEMVGPAAALFDSPPAPGIKGSSV